MAGAAVVVALAAVPSGGTDAADVRRVGAGSVRGMIVLTGGPPGAPSAAGGGTVIATIRGTPVARREVAPGGMFSFVLPEGRYRLAVTGAGLPCADATVVIAAGTDRTVSLVCSRK